MSSTHSTPGDRVNNFQDNLAGTEERTSSERHIGNVQQQGGIFVEAVRRTRMPMLVTDATLPSNPIVFANEAFVRLSRYTVEELVRPRSPLDERRADRSWGDPAI